MSCRCYAGLNELRKNVPVMSSLKARRVNWRLRWLDGVEPSHLYALGGA
jgi:hypothetical protein